MQEEKMEWEWGLGPHYNVICRMEYLEVCARIQSLELCCFVTFSN